MGTRGNITFKESFTDNEGKKNTWYIGTIYRQYDCYPTGLGQEVKDLIAGKSIINGIGGDNSIEKNHNGLGCLSAWLIGKLKGDEIGSVYLEPPQKRPDKYIDYTYLIENRAGVIYCTIYYYGKKICKAMPLKDIDMDKVESEG